MELIGFKFILHLTGLKKKTKNISTNPVRTKVLKKGSAAKLGSPGMSPGSQAAVLSVIQECVRCKNVLAHRA